MTWVKLDDRFATHPKVATLSDAAFRLHVLALCHSATHLTDGHLTRAQVVALAANLERRDTKGRRNGDGHPDAGATQVARELVHVGVWEADNGGIVIHDYLRYNPSREQVLKDRDAARQRMAFRRSSPERSPEVHPNGEAVRPKFGDPVPARPVEAKAVARSRELRPNSTSTHPTVREVLDGKRMRLTLDPGQPDSSIPTPEPDPGDLTPEDDDETPPEE